MVGALHGFDAPHEACLPELEQFILHQMSKLDKGPDGVSTLLLEGRLSTFTSRVFEFCQLVSSMWFDVRKDVLYCGARDDPERAAYLTTLARVFDHMVKWIAPVMPFAAEELWMARYPDERSVHMQLWPRDDHEFTHGDRWDRLMLKRSLALSVLEEARKNEEIKSSMEARLVITASLGDLADFQSIDFAQFTLVSSVEYREGDLAIEVLHALGAKCERCWQHTAEMGNELCSRCQDVVEAL
jgi:isoleucyl-tRNA synthetase